MAKKISAGSVADQQDKLSALLEAADPGLGNDAGALRNTPTFVPENMPVMPPSLAEAGNLAAAAAAGNKDTMAVAGKYDANYASTLRGIEDAIQHTERVSTMSTSIGVGGSAVSMPPTVRDIPNSLYAMIGPDGQHHYIRERADRLTKVVFGDEARRVNAAAGSAGQSQKPLVWVSQTLWFKFTVTPEIFDDLKFSKPFDPTMAAPGSTIHQALNLFLDALTVNQIIRLAKVNNGDVIDVVRAVMKRVLDQKKINVPSEEETEEINEEIRRNYRRAV